jgi:phospholipid transport system substrate-binding protein
VVKRIGLVILVLGLAVTGLGFGDKPGPDDDVVPSNNPEIRPLEMVTSSVSRGLANLRSPRVGFNTGEERRAEIRRATDDFFDVGDIARRALGQQWKGLGSRDRDEFVELFRAALTHSFVTVLQRYAGDHVASVDEEEVAGAFARVRSRITPSQGLETRIEYRLSRSGSQWTVYDIVLDGVSLVSSLRSQLSAIIGTSSVAQFLERLRTEPSWRPLSPDVMASAGPRA